MSPEEEFRPKRITKSRQQIILMPRWGTARVLIREVMITLPRITIIDGAGDQPAREANFMPAGGAAE